jgi:mitochondrial fission protein ELM1
METGAMTERAALPNAVWVLDDPRSGNAAQAIAIAERLGVPFRRIPLSWNWLAPMAALNRRGSLLGLAAPARGMADRAQPWSTAGSLVATPANAEGGGGPPALVLSSGSRSAAVALWLKARFGCVLVHCLPPGRNVLFGSDMFDLLVMPDLDAPIGGPAAGIGVGPALGAGPGGGSGTSGANVIRVLGAPHRVSPLLLRQAAGSWAERLSHLPRPAVALLVGGARERLFGGTGMPPARAHALGRHVARVVIEQGGSVLASTSRRTGGEATDALGAGLGRALHVLYRWGEPGDNPYHGYLATADAIVVTADSISMMAEACATGAPVFVALSELAGPRERRMVTAFAKAGQVRMLGEDVAGWPRKPLDEAGRVAREVRRLVQLD